MTNAEKLAKDAEKLANLIAFGGCLSCPAGRDEFGACRSEKTCHEI